MKTERPPDKHSEKASSKNRTSSARVSATLIGITLAILGGHLLLNNLGVYGWFESRLGHEWLPLFFLVFVAAMAYNAWRAYQDSGERLTPAVLWQVAGALILGVIIVAITIKIDWGTVWGVLLIAAGVIAVIFAGRGR